MQAQGLLAHMPRHLVAAVAVVKTQVLAPQQVLHPRTQQPNIMTILGAICLIATVHHCWAKLAATALVVQATYMAVAAVVVTGHLTPRVEALPMAAVLAAAVEELAFTTDMALAAGHRPMAVMVVREQARVAHPMGLDLAQVCSLEAAAVEVQTAVAAVAHQENV